MSRLNYHDSVHKRFEVITEKFKFKKMKWIYKEDAAVTSHSDLSAHWLKLYVNKEPRELAQSAFSINVNKHLDLKLAILT